MNGVVVKVKFYVFVLFADHVLVALQNHGFAIFETGCSGFANQDVAGLVDQRFKTEILTKFAKERSYLFLALRRTGNLVDLREAIEYGLRL